MNQLDLGIEVEQEHVKTYKWFVAEMQAGKIPTPEDFYKHIAMDHLSEHKKYYTYLEAMEELLEETV